MPDQIPSLTTDHLLLRPFAPSDVAPLARIYSSPTVMQYIRTGTQTSLQTADTIVRYQAAWQAGIGVWAVVEKSSGALAGQCGFVEHATLGYIIDQAFWGRGYATEAALACRDYGFANLGYPAISAGALRSNTASLRVIEKLGMRRIPNAFFDWNGGIFYTITFAEWMQLRSGE